MTALRSASPDPIAVEPSVLEEALAHLEAIDRHARTHRLERVYELPWSPDSDREGPYPWQVAFHNAGAEHIERASICANQVGKSWAASAEVAIHATGLYPKWWKGRRLTQPNDWWVCEPTNIFCRDIAQLLLLGGTVEENGSRAPDGTGWVPKDLIGEYGYRQCGVPNVIDSVRVRHVAGGWSSIQFKSYEQGPMMFEGATLNGGVWMDEEPEGNDAISIFGSCRTRIVVKDGMLIFTRTPLFGYSEIIQHFMAGIKGVWVQNVTWDDVPHMTPEKREAAMKSYPEHQRDARTKGIPLLGSGAVYPVTEDDWLCDPMPIPDHWRRICGIDFGIDHPAAAAWLAHDTDADCIYVYDSYEERGQTAAYHAAAINSRGRWIPVSWPHDGMIRDKGGGQQLRDLYREHGVNMLPQNATYEGSDRKGAQPREPITLDILERMRTHRFKVFRTQTVLREQLRMLHRKNGVIVPVRDDIESAVRYGAMMLRFALAGAEHRADRVEYTPPHNPLEGY